MYRVTLSRAAERYLERQDPKTQRRTIEVLSQLAEDPFRRGVKRLNDSQGRWSARVGSRRIIYAVDRDRQEILISQIGNRGQVYRDM